MQQLGLDTALLVLESPVRRRIVERLSKEPAYPLQLSNDLRIGQQLVTKHLSTMEKYGFVTSSLEYSPAGPKRKKYFLAKSLSVTVDLAPNLFSTRVLFFDSLPRGKVPSLALSLMSRVERIISSTDDKSRIAPLGELLNDVDTEIRELENKRAVLLFIRNLAMKEAAGTVARTEDSIDHRRVLYHMLDEHTSNVNDIVKSLDLREEDVRKILADLKGVL